MRLVAHPSYRKLRNGGVALKSDNQRFALAYQWDGDLLSGAKYRHTASRLGMEIIAGPYAAGRLGYIWSDRHRIS
ncbi:MAG: hypothetical protein IPG71_14040, partial [bacterium]|nr:hypothetical protein [bacterium]